MHLKANKAFRRGFAAGFSAPYRSVFGARARFVSAPDDLVSVAWRQVGESMRRAVESEKLQNGKSPLRAVEAD